MLKRGIQALETDFAYPLTPDILQWLACGQLGNRWPRAVRLWVLLTKLYGTEVNRLDLPQPFTYPDLRDRLFAASHPKSNSIKASELRSNCSDRTCICHQPLKTWLTQSTTQLEESAWRQAFSHLTGLSAARIDQQIEACLFACVHRSIRDDLKLLAKGGWLTKATDGGYQRLPVEKLPAAPDIPTSAPKFTSLEATQTWELLPVLERVSLVYPDLALFIDYLWENLPINAEIAPERQEHHNRFRWHLDYILSKEKRDRVDNYQEQLERVWRFPEGGIVKFNSWVASSERLVTVIVYPVCLHYSRRAKYLTAYGETPSGDINWHNYRLDRIASNRLEVLSWEDPQVPQDLQNMRQHGKLPTPAIVESELKKAWGFNFYLPSALLIMRFEPHFAKWYVEGTYRHRTFQPVAYQQLPQLIEQYIRDKGERQQVLEILRSRPATDAYYWALIRVGDINVLMRLRDWRPNGEAIAPLSVREKLKAEASQELENYNS